jgi:ribonucleoside-diphosphate reductase alpha chain
MPLETQTRNPFSSGIFVAPPQEISVDILLEKYAKDGEQSIDAVYQRVAKGLASVEKPELRTHYEHVFLANLHAGAIGAGRIMSAAGTDI